MTEMKSATTSNFTSLRSRIAAVLAAHQRDEGEPSGYCECGAIVFSGEMDGHQADAVIGTVSAYRREVSEDDFLDALSDADDE